MYFAVPLQRWTIIYPARAVNDTRDLGMQVGNTVRYTIAKPKHIEIRDDRTPTYVQALNDAISWSGELNFLFTILSVTSAGISIPTQVIVQKTMQPKKSDAAGVMSIATKVMIQLNCKLGGATWMNKFPIKGTMDST